MAYPYLKPHILFDSNGLAIWLGFSDITYIEVNYGTYSAILNLIKMKLFRAYFYLRPHILFHNT